jgi:FkbM family methyltransferase
MSHRIITGEAQRFRAPGPLERLARTLGGPLWRGPARRAASRALEAALTIGTAGRGLRCTLPGGEVIRILPKYRHASWNADEYHAFRHALAPGAVALDAGASVGSYALLFGQWVRPHGRVYAFEPAPDSREALERHIALNGIADVVVPVGKALSDRAATASFVLAGLHGISRLALAHEPASAIVETTTIDEFCERERVRPDLIKIDVEGAELAVLRGARETIRARRADLALFVEFHPSLWPSMGVTRDAMAAELAALGLTPEPIGAPVDPWTLEGVALRLRPI